MRWITLAAGLLLTAHTAAAEGLPVEGSTEVMAGGQILAVPITPPEGATHLIGVSGYWWAITPDVTYLGMRFFHTRGGVNIDVRHPVFATPGEMYANEVLPVFLPADAYRDVLPGDTFWLRANCDGPATARCYMGAIFWFK